MGKVNVKQTPKQLNPYGDKLMKIWFDDNEPPKNYIWYKDEEYHYWNGEAWVPFELGMVEHEDRNNHNKHKCNCCCEKDAKFEKFKKDVLAAVLKLIKAQNPDSAEALAARISALENDVNVLKAINHDLFVKNTELETLLDSLGYIKSTDIDSRLNDLESTVSDNSNLISDLNSRIDNIENAGYITASDLDGYATENYVNETISNINIPTKLSDLENDKNYISEVFLGVHSEPEDLRVISNGDIINLVEEITRDVDYSGNNIVNISMYPYKVDIATEHVEPYDDSALVESVNGLEDRVGSAEDRIDSAENRISSVENRMDSAESRIDSAENRIDSIEGDYIPIEKEIIISSAFNDLNDRVIDINNRLNQI